MTDCQSFNAKMYGFVLTESVLIFYKLTILGSVSLKASSVVFNRSSQDTMRTLTPGEWYLLYKCERCEKRQILFPDLSRGQARIRATYLVTCPECQHEAPYDSDSIERYQHPEELKQ